MNPMSLSDAVERVERLSLTDQKLLRAALVGYAYRKQPVMKAGNFAALEAAGLVLRVDDPAGYSIAPEVAKIARRLCTYLTRRNETDSYFDPERGRVDFPKGAEFVGTFGISGHASFGVQFPDDKITALLDLHGVNRCRTWQLPPKEGGA